jgi:hypothetical protein
MSKPKTKRNRVRKLYFKHFYREQHKKQKAQRFIPHPELFLPKDDSSEEEVIS